MNVEIGAARPLALGAQLRDVRRRRWPDRPLANVGTFNELETYTATTALNYNNWKDGRIRLSN